jgi:hypothetical protein
VDFALLLAVLYTKPTHDTESLHGQQYWDWVRTQSCLSDIMTCSRVQPFTGILVEVKASLSCSDVMDNWLDNSSKTLQLAQAQDEEQAICFFLSKSNPEDQDRVFLVTASEAYYTVALFTRDRAYAWAGFPDDEADAQAAFLDHSNESNK